MMNVLSLFRQRRASSIVVVSVIALLFLGSIGLVAGSNSLNCPASAPKTLFQCPNCGGINVTDCLKDCNGFLFQASQDGAHFCFDRTLFSPYNDTPYDYNNYYTYEWQNAVGALIWFITAGLAISCGIGGGSIYLPMGIILLKFAPSSASGLSQASIFGAAFGGILLNLSFKHTNHKIRNQPVLSDSTELGRQEPLRSIAEKQFLASDGDIKYYTRPLIPYDWILFFSPMEIAGATTGLIIQLMFPDWLYLICAVLVLSFTAWKTFEKFRMLRTSETAAKKREAELTHHENQQAATVAEAEATANAAVDEGNDEDDVESPAVEKPVLKSASTESLEKSIGDTKEPEDTASEALDSAEEPTELCDEGEVIFDNTNKNNDDLEQTKKVVVMVSEASDTAQLRKHYLEEDSKQYPWRRIGKLFILWTVLLVLTLLKGGKGVPSIIGITCQDALYGVIIALQFIWLFTFAAYHAFKLHANQQKRIAVHYPFLPGDQLWNKNQLLQYAGFTFVAGFIGGFIGISGGNFLGPFMLWKHVHPTVSAATTATMIILTSSSLAIMFVTSGLVPWSYAVFYFFVTTCGALFGKYNIDAYVKRTGRASLLVLILTGTMVFAIVGCLSILFTRLSSKDWCLDGFNQFCPPSSSNGECPANRFLAETIPGFLPI